MFDQSNQNHRLTCVSESDYSMNSPFQMVPPTQGLQHGGCPNGHRYTLDCLVLAYEALRLLRRDFLPNRGWVLFL